MTKCEHHPNFIDIQFLLGSVNQLLGFINCKTVNLNYAHKINAALLYYSYGPSKQVYALINSTIIISII